MSQRGRTDSSQGLKDPQRMPFEAAEALLWGKKTHDEHKFLFPRMRALEEYHKAYDHRIQATEVVAQAAQAATARIVRVEQKVDAIEADEQDRPFDKWVEGEISGFKGFIEKNKSVRQKQVELETKIYGLEDVVHKNRDAHRDVQILLERIARLENERINDSKAIHRLEGEVGRLEQELQERVTEHNPVINQPVHDPTPIHRASTPAFDRDYEVVNAAEETEDEDMLPGYPFEQPLQNAVPHRPRESRSPTAALPTSPQKSREHLSARLRMMQRNSIYEPKQSRDGEHLHIDSVPPTQIVDRRVARGRDSVGEVAANPARLSPRKSLIVRLKTPGVNTQTVKAEEDVAIPRVTRSQARKIHEAEQTQPTVAEQKHTIAALGTQAVDEPATKRRKLNDNRASAQALPKADGPKKAVAAQASGAANLKQSPRKSAIPTKYEQSTSRSVKSPSKKPARAAKETSSPQKKQTAQSQRVVTGPETVVHLGDVMPPNSRTTAIASSPQKKSKVHPKVVVRAPGPMEAARLDDAPLPSSSTVHIASKPRKKNAVQPKDAAKKSKTAKPDQMEDIPSISSRTIEVASSPRKRKAVQPKATSKTAMANDSANTDYPASTSKRTLQQTQSPRKKNPVQSKAAPKASRTIDPVPSDVSVASSSRLVSPKKTYAKSKAKREILPEVRPDTYDFIDDDEW